LRVIWSIRAISDLDEIIEYLEAFNPAAAGQIGGRLITVANSLSTFPERGRPSPFGTCEMVTVRPYILRYRVTGDIVEIIHVRHMARDNEAD
jgi:toxin ParE1/3/4